VRKGDAALLAERDRHGMHGVPCARASAGPGAAPLTVRQALLYQDRNCPLRICGRKILPAVVAGGGLVTP